MARTENDGDLILLWILDHFPVLFIIRWQGKNWHFATHLTKFQTKFYAKAKNSQRDNKSAFDAIQFWTWTKIPESRFSSKNFLYW